MSFIKKYSMWKQLNEQKSVQKSNASGEREKIVLKVIDQNSFEYKLVNPNLQPGTAIVGSNGEISKEAIEPLVNYVNGQTSITNTVGKLDDTFFKTNFLVYEVKKDKSGAFGRDVQVIVFSKAPRPADLPADVKALSANVVANKKYVDNSIVKGLSQAVAAASSPTSAGTSTSTVVKKELPAELAKKFPQVIKGATGKTISPSGKVILTTLVDIFKNSEKVSSTSLYSDFAKDIAGLDNSTGVLGDATDTMIKAVKAGYGLKDTDNGDLTAALVTSILIPEQAPKAAEPAKTDDAKTKMDNTMAAVEAGAIKPGTYTGNEVKAQDAAAAAAKPNESYFFGIDGKIHTRLMEDVADLLSQAAAAEVAASDAGGGIKGFDFQAYMTVAGKYSGLGTSFGDVDLSKVEYPLDPAKVGVAANPAVKAVQQALLNKFSKTTLADTAEFKKFKKFGADGKFGGSTKALVKLIKSFSDKYNTDQTAIITKEFMQDVANAKVE